MSQTVISYEPKTDPRNIASFRRESSFWKDLTLIDLREGVEVANVRFYGAKETVYCVAWLRTFRTTNGESGRGYGKAGGGGYHKPSAAMEQALEAAGLVLSEDIGGCGDSAMEGALLALAAHLGITRPFIHRAHA